MNEADNASSNVAVDSLLNYEVISWFSIALVSVPLSFPSCIVTIATSYQSSFGCIQTVKYFKNERFEVEKYDKYLKRE